MTVRHFILATAGHIDHGKSALVQRLTGTDPDRLPEEKRRGMTIDLGFAEFRPNPTLSIGIVDVPGHEHFIKNMVAGVGAVDAVMLVVAADDGWMPQTEEHLQILQHLNIRHGIVALTKIDRIQPHDLPAATSQVRTKLAGSFLSEAAIVPTSIHSGDGLNQLQIAIAELFGGMTVPVDIGKPRLQVDRSFLLRGVGRIVTGTLAGGTLSRGQSIVLTPSNTASRIRGIQAHNQDCDLAVPGSRIALNLPDLPATTDWRGQAVTLESLAPSHDVLDVALQRTARNESGVSLRRNLAIQVHHGTQTVRARIIPFRDADFAQLRLDSPLSIFTGDRLVLRDAAQRTTLAGAIVLDPTARRGGMQQDQRLTFLRDLASGIDDVAAAAAAIIAYRQVMRRGELLVQSGFSTAAVDAAIDRLQAAQVIFCCKEMIVARQRWDLIMGQLAEVIREFHAAHPEQAGMPLALLRQKIESDLQWDDPLEAAVVELVHRGFVLIQTAIRQADHRARLPARLESAGKRIRAALAACQLDPPPRSELTPDSVSQQALAFLKISNEVIELSPQVVIGADSYSAAVKSVRSFLAAHKQGTVTELKTAMGTSRRVAVPLLEKLDRDGITKRNGDLRYLR